MSVKYFGSDALNKLIDLVKTALGLKADDSNVVHKTGDETVAGNKTFTGTTVFSNANNNTPVRIKGDTNLNDAYVGFYDRSNNNLGFVGVKSDNLPYFAYGNSDKRLALLEEVPTDSDLVHKTGNETIDGQKTFSSMAVLKTGNGTTATAFQGGSNATEAWVVFRKGDGTNLGYMGVKSDNKPYFFNQDAKRLALLEETMPVYKNADITSHDCNSWTTPGIYQDANVSNSPVSGWITVVTIPLGSNNQNHCEQKLFPINSNAVYSRYRNAGTWSSWSNVSQIKSYRTSVITLSSLTWTQSSSGKYYTNTDSGLSSSDTIIGIFIADWGNMINGIIVQPYAGGNDNKIRLMSNTNSFGNAYMAFMVLYT